MASELSRDFCVIETSESDKNLCKKIVKNKIDEVTVKNKNHEADSAAKNSVSNENFKISEKLFKKLIALKNICKQKKKIYKVENSVPIPLLVDKDFLVKKGCRASIPVTSEHHVLNLTYTTSPSHYFRDHYAIFQYESIIDADHAVIPVSNIGESDFILKKGTKIAFAYNLDYENLPCLESNFSHPLEICVVEKSKNENISPREKALKEFENELASYPEDQRRFLSQYVDVFVPDQEFVLSKIKINPIKLKTKFKDIRPTKPLAKRNYTKRDEDAIDAFVATGLLNGLVEKIDENNPTETASPLHVVRRGSKVRVCLDMREINDLNIASFNYIFPSITEEISILCRHGYDSYFHADCTSAFNQLELDAESRNLTSFPVYTDKNKGMYRSTRVVFGMKSAPSLFASVLDRILLGLNQPHLDASLRSFIDDICGGARDHETQKKFLQLFFGRLREYNVKLSPSKSKFFQKEAHFCGVVINKDGYKIDPKRSKVLLDYPDFDCSSKTKNAIMKICGYFNWHRKFLPKYSSKEQIIRNTYKKYLQKEIDLENANKTIKGITDSFKKDIEKSILIAPKPGETVTVESDSCGSGYGYVVYTDRGIIAYGGNKYAPSIAGSHNIFELECLSIAKAVQDSAIYLTQAKNIILKNDNAAAVLSTNKIKAKMSSRAVKYLSVIQNFVSDLDVECVWLNSRSNLIADSISRMWYDDHGVITKENTDISAYTSEELNIEEYITYLHKHTHWSVRKMIQNLKLLGLNSIDPKKIFEIFRKCKKCFHSRRVGPLAKLNAPENPESPLDEVFLDFIDKSKINLQSANGHCSILTIQDHTSRFLITSAEINLKIAPCIDRLRTIMGILGRQIRKIYADNAFRSKIFLEFCKKEKIAVKFRPANLSRSVKLERRHRDLHEKIRAFQSENRDWDEILHRATSALNAQISDTTGFTPYYLMFGAQNNALNVDFDDHYKMNLALAKKLTDKKRSNENFQFRKLETGQKILIKYENSKNNKGIETEVVEDTGNSSVTVELNGRRHLVHKGHLFIKKENENYEKIFF